MLAWVEYPFLTEHLELLPPDIIDGVLGNDAAEIKAELKHGMQHLAYTSIQGSELLFPGYLSAERGEGMTQGHLRSAFEEISVRARAAKPLGVYGAAWDDSGLHSETFWLGWATVAQYGWAPGLAPVEQTAAEFMRIYYGPEAEGMMDIYEKLQRQARFFESSWDRVVSTVRGPGYGNSYGKGIGTTRHDETLPPPPLPSVPGLNFVPVYSGKYAKLGEEARQMSMENEGLRLLLYQNLGKVSRNRYNLEVLLSLAELTAHHNRFILTLKEIESRLARAKQAADRGNAKQAVGELVSAYDLADHISKERESMFRNVESVWEKSRFPKGQEVGGRRFIHVLDDVKDHWADRRSDLSYMIAPEESVNLQKWQDDLKSVIHAYAERNHLPIRPLEEMRLED